MNTQNLIIYKFSELYHILEELDQDLNFKITLVDNEKSLNEKVKNLHNYLILSNKKYLNTDHQFVLENNTSLKLTEKEINTIIYLSKSKIPVSIDELQEKVWSYQSDIESHTVETHIYRLRKKILNTFDDNGFILSKKNGYQIK